MRKGILLTFFYLMLVMESKVIDLVNWAAGLCLGLLDVVQSCHVRQLLRPLTVAASVAPDQSLNPTSGRGWVEDRMAHAIREGGGSWQGGP